ncbi:HNH endonuclease [Paraflavitalea pollutisoli]|uniref:HNH endonuclease n=1 Tax=Paraflavitalea pollutisoli TaxID=3034143 RepID=UPI0023EBBBE1|nr:hypothetical protein [Paraflavitalea sp. H1-2-19X]
MPEATYHHRYLAFKDESPYRRYVEVDKPKNAPKATNGDAPDTNTPVHGSYGGKLLHPKWKARRKAILARDRHRCIHCKNDNDLQVHHRQYHFVASQNQFRDPWDYSDHLLITLCERCHSRGHNKYKVPIITIQ